MGQTRITDDIYDMVQTECSRIGLRRTVEDLREARMAAFRKERFRGSLESWEQEKVSKTLDLAWKRTENLKGGEFGEVHKGLQRASKWEN